jgi:hypothetical protein
MFEQQVTLGPGTGTFTQHTLEILIMLLGAFLLGVWLGWMLWNKYKQEYVVYTPDEKPEILPIIEKVLAERDMVFPYTPLNVAQLEVDGILWSFIFYDNGLAVNVLYTLEEGGKRAVGFKLSDGIEIPKEFEGKFKFARQRSKLAGEIRGTFFVVKGDYL